MEIKYRQKNTKRQISIIKKKLRDKLKEKTRIKNKIFTKENIIKYYKMKEEKNVNHLTKNKVMKKLIKKHINKFCFKKIILIN